jgi:hypothetical protein
MALIPMKSALLILLLAAPAAAKEICLDPDKLVSGGQTILVWNRRPKREDFKALASTTTVKAGLLDQLSLKEYQIADIAWQWREQAIYSEAQELTINRLLAEIKHQKELLAECRSGRCP